MKNWIKLHCENGLGNIVLYESNGIYWVDFEGGNYDYDVMLTGCASNANAIEDIEPVQQEAYMAQVKDLDLTFFETFRP